MTKLTFPHRSSCGRNERTVIKIVTTTTEPIKQMNQIIFSLLIFILCYFSIIGENLQKVDRKKVPKVNFGNKLFKLFRMECLSLSV